MRDFPSSLGLYLSVPFCRAKCSFCNFASGVGSGEALASYLVQLCSEVRGARRLAAKRGLFLPETVDSVYFGGGTPSLMEPAQLQQLFAAIRDEFRVTDGAEITMEAAPGQIGDASLEAALALGVNRISLGVQSFVDREAQAVGRSHTEASCLAEFARLQRRGVRNLGADLIAGLPYQTEASWAQSLTIAAGCGLQHLSVYLLEVDEDSRLGREVLNGGARLHAPAVASDDLVATLYETACTFLPEAGYGQYEISNFATKNHVAKHNLRYWVREPYLGLGLDAHSMLLDTDGEAVRWANADELPAYTDAAYEPEMLRVSERDAFEEEVFLGLRLVRGLDRLRLRSYPAAWCRELDVQVDSLCATGLMGCDADRLWLTPEGRLLSTEVFGELLAGVVALV